MYEVYNGNPEFMKDETLQRWHKAMKSGGKAASLAAQPTTNNLISNSPIYINSVVEDASPKY